MPKDTIHLWPVEGVSLWPWPAVEFDATPDQWADLKRYVPPPFTDKPPKAVPAPEAPASPDDGGK